MYVLGTGECTVVCGLKSGPVGVSQGSGPSVLMATQMLIMPRQTTIVCEEACTHCFL